MPHWRVFGILLVLVISLLLIGFCILCGHKLWLKMRFVPSQPQTAEMLQNFELWKIDPEAQTGHPKPSFIWS